MNLWDEVHRMRDVLEDDGHQSVWDRLVAEGNLELLERLRRTERGEDGFMTYAVPPDGFSTNQMTNEAVIEWLRNHGATVLDARAEINALERLLYGSGFIFSVE